MFFFFKHKTAYEMRISDWISDVCSSDLVSRAATFQSVSLLAIFAYLILMMSATRALDVIGGEWVRIGQIGLVSAMTNMALVLLPSGKARAWMRGILAKHFFEHRYDYREEWLRFTTTGGLGGDGANGRASGRGRGGESGWESVG